MVSSGSSAIYQSVTEKDPRLSAPASRQVRLFIGTVSTLPPIAHQSSHL